MKRKASEITRDLGTPQTEKVDSKLKPFLAWLEREGARWEKVEFKHSGSWGWHAVVKKGEVITANEEIFVLPKALCINSVTVYEDCTFGPVAASTKRKLLTSASGLFEDVDLDRASVCAYIVYQKFLPKSRWCAYFDMMPQLEGFYENEIGIWLTDKSKLSLLEDTHLGNCIIPEFRRKHSLIFDHFVLPLLSKLTQELTKAPSASQLQRAFRWAACIFFSRAILVPFNSPGNCSHGFEKTKSYETITPLIDLLNHRPGTLSVLKQIHLSNKVYGIEYSNGRTLHAGEQVFLNYGPRSNEDLLAHFGFTLKSNVCDTVVLRFNCPDIVNGYKSFRLFRGGEIPAAMLDFVRKQLKQNSNAVAIDPTTIYRAPSVAVGSQEWLFNLCTAEDDNTDHVAEVSLGRIGSTLSTENETIMLKQLKDKINARKKLLLDRIKLGNKHGNFSQNVHNYIYGLVTVLDDASTYVEKLQSYLRPQVDNK